jgi:hypothetical protein
MVIDITTSSIRGGLNSSLLELKGGQLRYAKMKEIAITRERKRFSEIP